MKNAKYYAVVVAVIMAMAGAAAFVNGCGRNQKPDPASNVCPPTATSCPAPVVQQFVISKNSNFTAQVAEPVEVDAFVHTGDYSQPTKEKVWLERGTWILPEGMYSQNRADRKKHDNPKGFIQ